MSRVRSLQPAPISALRFNLIEARFPSSLAKGHVCATHSNCGNDSSRELFSQVTAVIPQNVVVLAGIKMHVTGPICSTCPNYRKTETNCVAGLKVDAGVGVSDVRDKEARTLDRRHDCGV